MPAGAGSIQTESPPGDCPKRPSIHNAVRLWKILVAQIYCPSDSKVQQIRENRGRAINWESQVRSQIKGFIETV
jgi:hypothetical protein